MRWIESKVEAIGPIDAADIIKKVEYAARTCYRSEDLITNNSAKKLISSCINRGHESVIEHGSITFCVTCDRGVSHEIVRHRLASYSQESTRYCAYNKEKFGGELTFIKPYWFGDKSKIIQQTDLIDACTDIEWIYLHMLSNGATPDVARAILPNCLATKIVITMNMREIRHFLKLRLSSKAHPDIQIIARKLLQLLIDNELTVFVEDIINEYNIQS